MSHAFREPQKVELSADTSENLKTANSDETQDTSGTGEAKPSTDSSMGASTESPGDSSESAQDDISDDLEDDACELESRAQEKEHVQKVLGTIIAGKYKIIELLGSGGMSEVFKAQDVTTKRPAALKLLRPKYMINPESVSRFQLEAKAASRLNHKNIVQVYEFGITEIGQPYLVMEYVSGKPLSTLVKESGRLSIARTWQILLQTCDALMHAHENGVIHRDLKPSNIMILDNDTIKIVDFGIAKVLSKDDTAPIALTQTGDIFGSPPYMSPEQGLGRDIDSRSDLYSLGCVMYECLTGSPPFTGDTALETLIKHQTESPISLEAACFGADFPQEIEKIVAKLLAKLPKKRYQTAGELKIDLLDYEQGSLDIGRFLKEPVEQPLQGRQDLSDFFDRVHRQTRRSLDHLEEAPPAPPKSTISDRLTYASFIALCLCGVIVMGCLLSELTHMSFPGRGLDTSTPPQVTTDPQATGNSPEDLTDEKTLHVNQLVNSKFPRLTLGGWVYTQDQWNQLARIPDVRYLDARDSSVTNQWIEAAVSKWKLISLDLSDCKTINEFSLGKLRLNPHLKRLSLSGTDVHNYTHEMLPANLEILDLSRTTINDQELKSMVSSGRLSHLKSLSLVGSKVTDNGLSCLSHLPGLRKLAISSGSLTKDGIQSLSNIRSLESLSVSGSAANIALVANLKQLQHLSVYTDYPASYMSGLQQQRPDLLIEIAAERKNEAGPWFWE